MYSHVYCKAEEEASGLQIQLLMLLMQFTAGGWWNSQHLPQWSLLPSLSECLSLGTC